MADTIEVIEGPDTVIEIEMPEPIIVEVLTPGPAGSGVPGPKGDPGDPGAAGPKGDPGQDAPVLEYLYDHVSDALVYQGWAEVGSTSAQAKWKISKTVIVGDDATVTWADSNQNFDNVWNNRAALTYG